jgi:hypothetical protein
MNAANRDDQPFARMTKISPAKNPEFPLYKPAGPFVCIGWLVIFHALPISDTLMPACANRCRRRFDHKESDDPGVAIDKVFFRQEARANL